MQALDLRASPYPAVYHEVDAPSARGDKPLYKSPRLWCIHLTRLIVAGPGNGAGLRIEGVQGMLTSCVARCDQHPASLRHHLRQSDEAPVAPAPEERAIAGPARFDMRWFNLHPTLVSQ